MNLKTIALIAGLVVIAAAGSWVAYDQTHLRLTAVSPKNHGTTTTTESVRMTFNHDLDPQMATSFTISPYIAGSAVVKKNQFVFTPTFSYQFDTDYTVTLKAPHSTGNLVGKDASVTFKTTYVPVDQQSAAQQKDGIAHTDPLEKTNPLAASLPYVNSHFQIDFRQDTVTAEFTYTITLFAIINRPSERPQYEAQLKAYKLEALDYIRSKGADPAKLTINYLPTEAAAY